MSARPNGKCNFPPYTCDLGIHRDDFARTQYVVNATRFEQQLFRQQYDMRSEWQPVTRDCSIKVGELYGRPVQIACSWMEIDGALVLFYYPSSELIDLTLISDWLEQNCNPVYGEGPWRARFWSNEFNQVMVAIEDSKPKPKVRRA